MIFQFLASVRRFLREIRQPSEFSSQWLRDQERASWQSEYQFTTWQAKEVGKRAYRVGEREEA